MAVKILKTALALAAVVAIGGALVVWFWFQGQREPFTEAALKRDLAKQDENAVAIPPQRLDRLSDVLRNLRVDRGSRGRRSRDRRGQTIHPLLANVENWR